MQLNRISINTASPEPVRARVLIIYTGGTFGMVKNKSGSLVPFDFSLILEHLPTLRNLFLDITVVSFAQPIDSSNVNPEHWIAIGKIIMDNYDAHDGFVVLHGTDTMAYTASALSFMLQNLNKPIIFTGAQLPIAEPRSDARENLITALEIASDKKDGQSIIREVCIFFGAELHRGCRSTKAESQHFDAFQSENYPLLAEAGVIIDYNFKVILQPGNKGPIRLLDNLDTNVAVLKLFPGLSKQLVEQIVDTPGLKGLILETFGAGNSPTYTWIVEAFRNAIKKGIVIINISQCSGGMVEQGKYETSRYLNELGVISGRDMTTEAAITKLMIALGEFENEGVAKFMMTSIAGEIS